MLFRSLDFGAGTGLLAGKIAPRVKGIVAVDVSPAMLEQLAKKPELAGKVETVCQDILAAPLRRTFDGVAGSYVLDRHGAVSDGRISLFEVRDGAWTYAGPAPTLRRVDT